MKLLPLLLLGMLAAPLGAGAQEAIFINPGFKLGYTFGDRGGFTIGFELSVTGYWSTSNVLGATLSYDYCGRAHRHKYHFGVEGAYGLMGIDVGPTWVVENEEARIGASITPYVGLVLYPYYSLTVVNGGSPLHEAGGYAKLPIPARGRINIL